MPNIVFKADASEFIDFMEAFKNKSHLLEGIPKEFVMSRLKNLTVFESTPETEAGNIVVKFRIPGTVESFIASTLRACNCEGFAHHASE